MHVGSGKLVSISGFPNISPCHPVGKGVNQNEEVPTVITDEVRRIGGGGGELGRLQKPAPARSG
jgi:hypothetical protein